MFRLFLLVVFALAPVSAVAERGAGPQLVLQDGAHSVHGQLVAAEDGEGLEGVRVILTRLSWNGDPLPEPWAPAEPVGEPLGMVGTGQDGIFELRGLAAGTYQLQPRLPDVAPLTFTTSEEQTQQLRYELVAGRKVTVRLHAGGTPVTGASLLVSGFQEGNNEGERGRLRTAGELRHYSPVLMERSSQVVRGLPEGQIWLKAWHEDWGYSSAQHVDLTGDPSAAVAVDLELRGPQIGLQLPSDAPTSFYNGVGFRLGSQRGTGPRIDELFEDSPGALAGLEVGDLVLAIDGQDTRWMRSAELIQRTHGPVGSTLRIEVARGETRLEVDVIRGRIEVSP